MHAWESNGFIGILFRRYTPRRVRRSQLIHIGQVSPSCAVYYQHYDVVANVDRIAGRTREISNVHTGRARGK